VGEVELADGFVEHQAFDQDADQVIVDQVPRQT
jgi:hypothetical protein